MTDETLAARRSELMAGFGRRLRAARILARYETSEDFAVAVGLHKHRYQSYERGRSFPPIEVLEIFATRLPVRLDYLLFGFKVDPSSPFE